MVCGGRGSRLIVFATAVLLFGVRAARGDPCREVSIPVELAPPGVGCETAACAVRGVLCETGSTTLLLFTAGATEGGITYWDFPGPDLYKSDPATYQPYRDRYSFVKFLTDTGYSSLTLDRIGTGGSSHPPPELVTMETNVYVIRQVIEALRAKNVPGQGATYSKVIGVGRSLSATMMYMVNSGLFADGLADADVDGIITESFSQHFQANFAKFPTTLHPAEFKCANSLESDPRFETLPPGYLTTDCDTRGWLFLPPSNTDPQVIALDERTKETLTDGEIATFVGMWNTSHLVKVPVLSIIGDYDSFFCPGPLGADCEPGPLDPPESMQFGNGILTYEVIHNFGHDMNLQFDSATKVFPKIADWVRLHFGAP